MLESTEAKLFPIYLVSVDFYLTSGIFLDGSWALLVFGMFNETLVQYEFKVVGSNPAEHEKYKHSWPSSRCLW